MVLIDTKNSISKSFTMWWDFPDHITQLFILLSIMDLKKSVANRSKFARNKSRYIKNTEEIAYFLRACSI